MTGLSEEALDALSQAVSERLTAVVPEGASPDISAVHVWWQLDGVLNQPGVFEDDAVDPYINVLNDAQDQIMRDLKEGWPRSVAGTPGKPDPANILPEAQATIVSGTLRLWYGDAQRPALELPPIDLTALENVGR